MADVSVFSVTDVFSPPRQRAEEKLVSGLVTTSDGREIHLAENMLRMLEFLCAAPDSAVARLQIDEELVTPERAAEILGVSRPTIYNWQERNRLGCVFQGKRRMVPMADIAWLSEHPARRVVVEVADGLHGDPDGALKPEDVESLRP